jgi:hypothetical protein
MNENTVNPNQKIESRYFDPKLIWEIARNKHKYAVRKKEDPCIVFYLFNKKGVYRIRKGRLYWDADPKDQFFGKTDPDRLEKEYRNIREIIVECDGLSTDIFFSYQQFAKWLVLITKGVI